MLIRSFAGAAARLVLAAFVIAAFSAAAEAAVYISYVASNGNDANPCTVVTAPCKTLTRAVAVTSNKGTVKVLTPLQGGAVVAKSITIEGGGAAIVGQITIGSASAVVTLRGLALNGVGVIANGIRIDSAAAVHIEDCTVERYTNAGIKLSASTATELFVSNTASRNNTDSGLYVIDSNARVTVDNSRFENNAATGLYLIAAKMNVTRSVASGNALYGLVLSTGTANVTETTAADNSVDGFYLTGGVVATVASSVAYGSVEFGLIVIAGSSANVIDSTFTSNGTGIGNRGTLLVINSLIVTIENSGTLYTRQNNTVGGNYTGPAPIAYSAF